METSLTKSEIKEYLGAQLEHFFPDKYKFEGQDIDQALNLALDRVEYCFSHIAVQAYNKDEKPYFQHLHGDQWAAFLYYFSNSLWNISQNRPICDKVVYLNKILNGCLVTYNAGLPDIFLWSHPVGTVLGNAEYGNYFFCCQNCTIASRKGHGVSKPAFGKGLYLCAGSKIVNLDAQIGDRVVIGAGTILYENIMIQGDCTVVRKSEEGIKLYPKSREDYNRRNIFKDYI